MRKIFSRVLGMGASNVDVRWTNKAGKKIMNNVQIWGTRAWRMGRRGKMKKWQGGVSEAFMEEVERRRWGGRMKMRTESNDKIPSLFYLGGLI